MRSQGAAAEGRRVRDLIEAGLSEAAARLSAMGKVSARSATPMCQGLSRGRAHAACERTASQGEIGLGERAPLGSRASSPICANFRDSHG